MRITRAIREQAALICQIAASNEWTDCPDIPGGGMPEPARTSPAHALAWAANKAARKVWDEISWSDGWRPEAHWAEAESLLRTGWRP